MALNWVMLDPAKPQKFVPLPSEAILYTSSARTSFQLSANITSSSGSPKADPYNLKASGGVTYVTTQRVIYLPTSPTRDFESFSSPITSIHDGHVATPLFGPNVWVATITPTPNGNLPAHSSIYDYELKLTFKDGGAFDFQSAYEVRKEEVQNALELGEDVQSALSMEGLPSYEDCGVARPLDASSHGGYSAPPSTAPPPPDGPPPGYEEAQMQGLQQGLPGRE